MAAHQRISSGGPWEEKLGYSRAVVAGDHVYVAGSTATLNGQVQHPGDPYLQTKVILESIVGPALAEAGHSITDVVRTRVYLRSVDDAEEAGRAQAEFFGEHRPASTLMGNLTFVHPDMLVEIDVDSVKA